LEPTHERSACRCETVEAAVSADWTHVPVLAAAVLEHLAPQPGQTIVDATTGLGGHTKLLAERVGDTGRILAIDRDAESLSEAQERVTLGNIEWIHGEFSELTLILRRRGIATVDGLLVDLGASSPQLDRAERGFSFMRQGPLDMRMDPTSGEPASSMIARMSAKQLADMFWEFGEERMSRRIARAIVAERERTPITSTTQLAEIVRRSVPPSRTPNRIDPATRVFQALRIAVNNELDALDALVAQAPSIVRLEGRMSVISFHSLEDRRVKNAFRGPEWESITKKPVVATEEEMAANPRSRSAKLRSAIRRNRTN
jgi:16S rRNA (cytosine1402-N4)-methyltransferase